MGFNKIIISVFKHSFENHCLILLIEAYNSSISKKIYTADWMENDFTEMLDQYITDNKKRIKWRINNTTEKHLHDKSHIEKGFADKEKRIDMRMSQIKFQNEYHFYIEAKRLKEHDYALKKRYIDTGIDNYINSIYPKGILVGYLQEGDVDNTIQGINDILNQYNRASECLCRKEHVIHDEYFESVHPNFGIIQHFVLNYTA
ncbi:MAG: hypothetical protein IKG83_09320 [Prevotella sp.]|nr:hypothetical protein [Prevotella sp.]